jgi:hypothetical protein
LWEAISQQEGALSSATEHGVPHNPDFLESLLGSANFMRLSIKERRTPGFVRRSEQETRGISLVFREMWDATNPNDFVCGAKDCEFAAVVSHISRNTSEIWGTSCSVAGKE